MQAVSDAFRDAAALGEALDLVFSDRANFDQKMAECQCVRDETVRSMHEMTCSLARLDPLSPQQQVLFEAFRANPLATNAFFGTIAETVPVESRTNLQHP